MSATILPDPTSPAAAVLFVILVNGAVTPDEMRLGMPQFVACIEKLRDTGWPVRCSGGWVRARRWHLRRKDQCVVLNDGKAWDWRAKVTEAWQPVRA